MAGYVILSANDKPKVHGMRKTSPLKRNSAALAICATAACTVITAGPRATAQEQETFFPGRAGSTLGTPDQVARDSQAARIFQSPAVQKAMQDLETVYENSPTGALPDAMLTIKRAVAATAMSSATAVVNKDADCPGVYWSITSPHSWGVVKVPLAGLMLDNTDNIYRGIPIDGASAYEIRGKVIKPAPAQVTFILHEVRSGATKDQKVKNQQDENGYVALDKLPLGPDGSFTITIDNSPVGSRRNHIQSNPQVHEGYLLIRDTLSDWSKENPVQLSVRRVAGPPDRPVLSEAELVEKAAALTTSQGAYWLAWGQKVFFSRPVNTYTHIVSRVSGWGFIKCGHYSVKDDEALVVRLEARQAASLGFQLSDVWGQGQSANFIEKTGSLNGTQARPNADGSYTYAISVADPGVHNWLDPSGLHAGTFCTRWQNLPAGVNSDDAVKTMEIVKLSALRRYFPAKADWVTPAERDAQREARVASFQRRLTN